ncbi:hypothetical protein [Gloeobacter violaceus]|uniref:Glr4233 protein n=1 Tax=Gloeobacter violaceus (strain ATCC 29082 / PCC 7421) TaxID=251221 RepID=Q7NDK2_GLOVI|nr:hypothetical protein [Gloeobacter violaceus]BAC92174.1 glr4233 [Gloeobacter violaceus PCC 7421]
MCTRQCVGTALALFLATLAWAPAALPAPLDVQVSELGVIDPEFDSLAARFTWVDTFGSVWIGHVDPATGDFVPRSGQSVLVDTGAVPLGAVVNGPEWVYSASGPQIVFTKYDQARRRAIARARAGAEGWRSEVLQGGSNRFQPIGSLDRSDPQPRIAYTGPQQQVLWRQLDDPASETVVPDADPGIRWVPGRRAMTYSAVVDGGRQAFLYDIDTQVREQLTFDAGAKKAVYLWQAPEYNSEYLLFALVDQSSIGVYRKLGEAWSRIATLKPPAVGNYLFSPEVFVYGGKSYIFMATSTSRDQASKTVPTDIWLAGIEPAAPFYRQLSDATPRVRKDPEFFLTAQGPVVFYLAYLDPETTAIFRCNAGLGVLR